MKTFAEENWAVFLYMFVKMNIIYFSICQKMFTVSAQQQPNLCLLNVKVEFLNFDAQQKYQEEVAYL